MADLVVGSHVCARGILQAPLGALQAPEQRRVAKLAATEVRQDR
jgi:hypothetical protein